MKWLDDLMDRLGEKLIPRAIVEKYEKDVVGNSFDVLKIPKTSKYYEAYMVGFIHGKSAYKSGHFMRIEITIDRMIKYKKEAESKVAADAMAEAKI